MRKAISLIVLTSEGLLLTKKRETWILPGGKPLDGETNYICLFRELKEELPYSQISITRHYQNFIGRTPHKWYLRSRGEEIKSWLDEYKDQNIESFVIIDDCNDMDPYMDHLVQTDHKIGLQDQDVEKAIKILENIVHV